VQKYLEISKKFVGDEEGAALIEYTVLLGMMLVAVIGLIVGLGNWVSTKWAHLCGPVLTGCAAGVE
jgi:pilus assembly protein Flp/PilA